MCTFPYLCLLQITRRYAQFSDPKQRQYPSTIHFRRISLINPACLWCPHLWKIPYWALSHSEATNSQALGQIIATSHRPKIGAAYPSTSSLAVLGALSMGGLVKRRFVVAFWSAANNKEWGYVGPWTMKNCNSTHKYGKIGRLNAQ